MKFKELGLKAKELGTTKQSLYQKIKKGDLEANKVNEHTYITEGNTTEIISLINIKGGVGKSTSAVHIGDYFASCGFKVLLIDLDPQDNIKYFFSM